MSTVAETTHDTPPKLHNSHAVRALSAHVSESLLIIIAPAGRGMAFRQVSTVWDRT
jgi:hypothetical protein